MILGKSGSFKPGERVILNNGDTATLVKPLGTVSGKPQVWSIKTDSGNASWVPETEMERLASNEGIGMQRTVKVIDEAAWRSTQIARKPDEEFWSNT